VTAPTTDDELSPLTREALGLDDQGRPVVTGPTGPTGRAGRATSRPATGWWRYGFPAALVTLILAIPVLLYAGSRVVLESSDGRLVETVTDPTRPGFQAIVDPTPVMLVASVDDEGVLDGLTLLTLTADGVGGAVQIPADTVFGGVTLSYLHATQGIDAMRSAVEGIVGLGIPEVDEVTPAEWENLVGPVAPLTVNNPDPVSEVDERGVPTVVFPRGSLSLSAEEVPRYLSGRSPGETDLALMIRRQALWEAWLAAVAATGGQTAGQPGVVPGEVESGLGRFIPTLAADQVDHSTLPVNQVAPDGGAPAYEPDVPAIRELVESLVPFPAGPEGARVRTEVLDGTGGLDAGLGVAVLLGTAGAQVQKVGNASEFGVETTRIVYFDEAQRPLVDALREALGVGEVVRSDAINSAVDVSIVLGADFLGARPDVVAPPLSLTPGTPDGETAD
jgi:hypothetical protein